MRRVAAAVAVAALLISGPVLADEPAIDDVPDGIVQLLEDYSAAYLNKDRVLMTGLLEGEGFAADELRALGNAEAVPFAEYRARVTTRYSGDLASPRVRARYDPREVAVFHVVTETRMDIEDGSYVVDSAFTFVRTDRPAYRGWRLAGKDDLDPLGFHSARDLWDQGPVAVRRSERFLLLTHPEVADELEALLPMAEEAYDQATAYWPVDTDDRYVIIVPSTTAELDLLIRATVDLEKFVAFVAAGVKRDQGWEPAYPRVFVHLSHIRNYGRAAKVEIFAHELIHAVTRPVSGPHIPAWVEEGLANAGGGSGGRPSTARDGEPPEAFPSDDVFSTGEVRSIQRAYDRSQVAIEVLTDAHGIDGTARFYEALGARRVVAGTHRYHVAQAVEEAVGWSEQTWLEAWRGALR